MAALETSRSVGRGRSDWTGLSASISGRPQGDFAISIIPNGIHAENPVVTGFAEVDVAGADRSTLVVAAFSAASARKHYFFMGGKCRETMPRAQGAALFSLERRSGPVPADNGEQDCRVM
jgi:hypothetical protein